MEPVDFANLQLPQDPIFIVGYPRSGTTLVQALLATQEDVYTLPETHFFNVIHRKAVRTDEQGFIEPDCLDKVFDKIYEKMDMRFQPREVEHITRLTEEKRLKPKLLFEIIVHHYISKETEEKNAEPFRWIEKTPNHAYFLEHILSFYPQAQFINIIRHPVPAIYSRKINFPFNRDKPLEELAQLWRRSIEETESFARKHAGKLHSLKYENLTADLEKELKKICDFVKLTLNMELVKHHSTAARRFIIASEAWKSKNSYNDISNTNDEYLEIVPKKGAEYIETLLADKMKEHGYAPFFTGK